MCCSYTKIIFVDKSDWAYYAALVSFVKLVNMSISIANRRKQAYPPAAGGLAHCGLSAA